ncbi:MULTISPECIES: ATP-dependent nuclease [unclassified Pseudoalteromonas]|uniref:ATP-dependent nuclease n=1 Tax=unclassified Pseudoalteromonas TaxID=194690 RepID=UPI00160334CB|nr:MULTISPECIES: ATP-binding protein [unclassified Pseudoalteromonas]MBB1334693.1 ATP-binding protein [Pseudoalteromonas sp. SR41-6]MBB1460162.1 ATP-binding protein [Pseudoalteromonas sp. SG41-8]
MSVIRHLQIQNFRSIKNLSWSPKPGLNCLIGSGDAGKSTILDAIDLALGARRAYSFNDADFYQLDTTSPLVITITIGDLHDELKNVERYGSFLRGFNSATKAISDEPQTDTETVLTIKLHVDADLAPDWRLYSERADADGLERRLPWKHRELLSPARLGTTSNQNLAWGNRSVLNKLSEETLDVSAVLALLGRQTRAAFAERQVHGITEVLNQVQLIANGLGVPVGQLSALLDVNGISMSNGAISLHNNDGTPLRQLGTGSSRLLISGLQKATSCSNILIVDEAEYGLEPYRITRLLNELGSKDTQPTQQVFITTHSPYVLRELQANQLHVVRKLTPLPPIQNQPAINPLYSHSIFSLNNGEEEQSTLRVCAEAFLSKAVIVCEGKTEIGLVRGIDLYNQERDQQTILAKGVYCADGGGDSMFTRAKVFKSLGYPTSLFKDSDKAQEHQQLTTEMVRLGIPTFEWMNGNATEDALFLACPINLINNLLNLAISRKGEDSIRAHIVNYSNNQITLDDCREHFNDNHRAVLAKVANKKSWFKDIDPAESIARNTIAPNYQSFSPILTHTLTGLYQWAYNQGNS